MTTKEYLRQVPMLDKIIDLKLAQLERLKSLRERVTTAITPTPKGKGGGDRISEVSIKIWSLEEEINKDVDRLVDLKSDIRRAIDGLENERHKMVLEYRYLLGYKWDDIATVMGNIDLRWVYRMHGRALQNINIS